MFSRKHLLEKKHALTISLKEKGYKVNHTENSVKPFHIDVTGAPIHTLATCAHLQIRKNFTSTPAFSPALGFFHWNRRKPLYPGQLCEFSTVTHLSPGRKEGTQESQNSRPVLVLQHVQVTSLTGLAVTSLLDLNTAHPATEKMENAEPQPQDFLVQRRFLVPPKPDSKGRWV